MQLVQVALDLLLEAFRRRWFLALFGGITVVLLVLGLTLQLDVVDGAIAGSSLFGKTLLKDMFIGDTVLGALYFGVALVSFYGGALFLTVACSDFATELLAPGRIEHLLSLPVARWQLLFGTWLGVVALAALGTLYGSVGLTVLLGLKSGLWSLGLVQGSLLGWAGFAAIYSAMLAVAFFVRSSALSSAAGLLTLLLGVLSSHRESVVAVLSPGPGRWAFRALVMPFPRLHDLAMASANVAMHHRVEWPIVARLLVACFIFAGGLLCVAAFRFERKDF
jgi:ABC-type transport system involved in multi-copper enzyme maturation permease subunit